MTNLTTKKLHARLTSTRDLLIDLSHETQSTVRALTLSELDPDTWFAYRKLADAIQNAANDATFLTASVSPHAQETELADKQVAA
jgi:hypothetical protein